MVRTTGRSVRAGRYAPQPAGYSAFIPAPLPPDPPVLLDEELLNLLSAADQAIGRLDASGDILPNPDLFVAMYVRKEAVLSSQIEGTQASLTDVLEYELIQAKRGRRSDVGEVVNYVAAMNYGLEKLGDNPLSSRLLLEIHKELLKGVRGSEKSPGRLREFQNSIGGADSSPRNAAFVPPPPSEVGPAVDDIEAFIESTVRTPILIKAGLIHSQFETIHPFLDGNGRMGRLLITFLLSQHGVLKRPILYLSAYFKQHRQEYYERLQAVRDSGDWEQWLKFFLMAVLDVSQEAADTAHQILALREGHRQTVQHSKFGTVSSLELLDHLFQEPYLSVPRAAELLAVSYPTANTLVDALVGVGLLVEVTGQRRGRVFRYDPYLRLLEKGTEAPGPGET